MVYNNNEIINKIFLWSNNLQSFHKPLLCFWFETKTSCYRNCRPGPSNELFLQNNWQYSLLNYLDLKAVVNFSHENKFENWLQFEPTFLSNVHFLSLISRHRLILMDLHVHSRFRLSYQLKPKKKGLNKNDKHIIILITLRCQLNE